MKKELNISIYRSIRELKLLVFWEILRTDNVTMLYKQYDESKKYTEAQVQNAKKQWTIISDEYFEAKNDDRSKSYLKTRREELILATKLRTLNDVHTTLSKMQDSAQHIGMAEMSGMLEKLYKAIKRVEPRLKISEFNTIAKNLKVLEGALNSMSNQYRLKFTKKKEHIKREGDNMYTVVALIEEHLERSLGDLNNVTVQQFLAYEKLANKKAKAKIAAANKQKGGLRGR